MEQQKIEQREDRTMLGCRFGKLTVMEEAPRRNGRRYWRCVCDCGTECVVDGGHRRSGHTRSCGCLSRTANRERTTDLTGQRFGRLTAVERVIDPKKNIQVWKCRCDCGQILSCQAEHLTRGHTKSCGCLREEQRRENMKKAIHHVDGTCIEKIACQREYTSNTSGHRGVHLLKNGRFRAAITFRNRRYDLGTHATFEEAVDARKKGEQRYYGEFLESWYATQKAGEA